MSHLTCITISPHKCLNSGMLSYTFLRSTHSGVGAASQDEGCLSHMRERERINPIFSSVLSQNSKLLVIAQLHPRSTEHLMSNIHLHNTIQHAFAALMQVQTPHLCIVILSRTSCTHHQQQRRRQWIIFAVPTETKLGSTTFRFGSEHQRKMSSINRVDECVGGSII